MGGPPYTLQDSTEARRLGLRIAPIVFMIVERAAFAAALGVVTLSRSSCSVRAAAEATRVHVKSTTLCSPTLGVSES
jgi:hypothetical protein